MSRFLLIGLDGAEPGLVEPWMDEGLLPNLRRLRDRGCFMPMASTIPATTFPAWTTCVTGVNPGRHGVFDFTEMIPGRYAVRFINGTFRKAPALWTILSAAGKRVCVLGVPATYPPERVNGVMVSGFDSPVCGAVDRSFVYPEDLYDEVRDWRFADFQESRIGSGWHEAALAKMLRNIEVKEEIAGRLLGREPWDFFMVVFGESDTVSHHFWMFHDAASPRNFGDTIPMVSPKFQTDPILRVYQRLDAAVGTLIAAAGDDVLVAVVSDHGFGGAGTGVVHLNNWLAERGYLCFENARDSLLKRAALGVIPESWRGTLFRHFDRLASKAESRSRFGGINWRGTRAWSEELNYFPSVRINIEGREPLGQVSVADYDGFRDHLCRELETWAPIRKAWRRTELYTGDWVEKAPDIILELELEGGYSHSCLRSRGGPSFRRLVPSEYTGGKGHGMNGNHRPNGILFLSKPTAASVASIEDVAPTVLAAMGVAGPEIPSSAYSPEQEREIEERLRALGYLE